jgi:UDP-glucose 4-epimerase
LGLVAFNRADNAAAFTNHAFTAVVHLAARVHVMKESAEDPLAAGFDALCT